MSRVFARLFVWPGLIAGFVVSLAQSAAAATPDDPSNTGAPIIVPFEAAVGTWVELYVNPSTGNDSGDGSSGAPLRTLGAAMSRATGQATPQPTRINLAAGTYAGLGSYGNVQRTAGSPIKISGATNAGGDPLAIVDGGANGVDAAGAMCIRFSSVSYIIVENIRCQNAFPHGSNIDDGGNYATRTHNLVLRNWRVRNVGVYSNLAAAGNSDCLKITGVDDFWIVDSELENCVRGEFIDMVGSHRGVIARNYFHDKPGNGVQTKGGSTDVLITRNTFERVELRFIQLGGSVDPEDYRPSDAPYPASRIDVIANVVRGAGIYGGSTDNRTLVFSLNGCNDCVVAHNTVIDIQFDAAIAYIDKEEAAKPGNNDVILANNIYVMDDGENRPRSSRPEYVVSARGEPTAGEIQFRNEIYYDADEPGSNPIDLPAAIDPAQFQGTAVVNPQVGENARLAPNSPAIGFGTAGLSSRVPGDYLGGSYGNPPDAGAFSSSFLQPNPPVLSGVQ